MPLQHVRTTSILRSLDEAAARAFYMDYLGFTVDWDLDGYVLFFGRPA